MPGPLRPQFSKPYRIPGFMLPGTSPGLRASNHLMTSRAKRIAIGLSVAVLLASWAMTLDGFFVSPDILRRTDQERGEAVAGAYGATLENVSIRASDGATLKGWLFTPQNYHGRAVLLVHAGVGNRREMLGHAEWLLTRGYACLLVDQRGCGTSGGRISWGVNEPADISAWAVWLRDRTHASAVFGCGVSRGSTTLLQSLALKAPFTALALEATGAGNIAQPYKFISDKMGISERRARMTWWPLIEPSFWWIRLRYGLDMKSAQDGVAAIRGSQVAVLLIHGSEDQGAALAGAERLRDANPQRTDLVVIRGANHEWFSEDRPEIMIRLLAWFDAHAKS
jgi:dipeptidyl aminopeptidase/acylaminoacyl peptidase